MIALRRGVYALAALLLAALALCGGLWMWGGSSHSLATSLQHASRWLGSGQTLEARGVSGSLRRGGHLDWLRWQQDDLSLEANDVSIAWSLRPLLGGELRLTELRIRRLLVVRRATSASAPTPPTALHLPLRVNANFAVEQISWEGAPLPTLAEIAGSYVFDSNEHRLDITKVAVSTGSYQLHARLQAHAPMTLDAQLRGSLQTTFPVSGRSVTVQAQAELRGPLAGRDAVLTLQGQLQPQLDAPGGTMQARITARLRPWQTQPVADGHAQWQALNLAALWPQAPVTLLSGQGDVAPKGQAWRATLKMTNTQSGPWDRQRLPIDELSAAVLFSQGQWTVESLLARAAGGRLEAQGTLAALPSNASLPAAWQGHASAHDVDPAALDSRLASTRLDGQLSAQHTPSGIRFETRLQTAAAPAAPRRTSPVGTRPTLGMRLKAAHAQGLWRSPLLTVETLSVQTDDAQLQGRLVVQTATQGVEGQLALTAPGADARLAGQLASERGQGELQLHVTDAAAATRWLARWPQASAAWLGNTPVQGSLDLAGRWQGGWRQQGRDVQIEASLRAARLDLLAADATPSWRGRDLQLELSGALPALRLSARGQLERGTRRFTLQAQARAGRENDGIWKASLDNAQLGAEDTLQPGLWTLQLQSSVALNWQQRGGLQSVELSPGSAQLSGPVPGLAKLNWQRASWAQQPSSHRADWRTQGTLQDLPMAWLVLFGPSQMANIGLRGDMLFAGQWDATGGAALQARASLARSSGDLQVQVGDTGTTVPAGVREARLQLSVDRTQLSATLAWDSERGGQAQATLSSALADDAGTWQWPLSAPLAGSLNARLPPVGAWSMLAPPGWRLRGTLDASATLSGTRAAPQWQGTLRAQDLSVRSVVDGIDFSHGNLLARLDRQRLEIVDASLQGAGGASGGQLALKGSMTWLPAQGDGGTVLSRLHVDLDATARQLRVSTRADRRLVVSGQLSARLRDTQLNVRGALKADQALFVLPDDSAPQLGDDVVLLRPSPKGTTSTPASVARAARITSELAITLDPGPDFQIRGHGLSTRLAGSLELRHTTAGGQPPRLLGELSTRRGTYKAYGQLLDIDQGVLRFSGPYDNPTLAILAIRPNLQQRVGVQISGTAQAPAVRLYAEPDLPDAEKLSWLVLGRAAANGGAESAMLQQAALALLGGNGKNLSSSLTEALGLDELSVRGAASTSSGTATNATFTLGKRLSRDFYVSYEHSLAGTLGTLYIFYDLSRRITVRAQTGEQSAIDLIFTVPYD